MNGVSISPLRRRMIEDMTVRKFVEKTQKDYIRHVKGLTIFPLPQAQALHRQRDLRRVPAHLAAPAPVPARLLTGDAAFLTQRHRDAAFH